MNERFSWPVRPKALADNVISGKNYRFTVLTSRLLRLEYDSNGKFEDRASQSFFYRDFDKTSFSKSLKDGILNIETEHLILTYSENSPFSDHTLKIQLKTEPASSWCYGEDFEDLGGTVPTLDRVNGSIPLLRGVCSRNGFSVLDDSETLMLDESGWVDIRHGSETDLYFFGYGFDYTGAIADFYRLTGIPGMLPAYAFGNWWSRYHKYTDEEYIALMERFKNENVPFSVAVIDMDWHITEIPPEKREAEEGVSSGWTGYSWNKDLFPDYKAFLKYLHDNNLKTSLNLHPHAGIRQHEDMYEEMARACGIDPESKERVRFDILSKTFMKNYFDIVHHPYEENGVDFWWMDWQQGKSYYWLHEPNTDGNLKDERETLDPNWMLNHLHILDISRTGKRPMFFSRYSGPGSHRYPVGFSGDSFCTWESLDFQPYFTATASNIGYAWWSHDIGGHQLGYHNDELTTRWLQLGVFSPVNRLHSMDSDFQRKEPWCYGKQAEEIMKTWLRLRHCLFPYLYTMNYRLHKNLLPLVQPMYYTHPKNSAAYEVPNQFWFGSELMVSSITSPSDSCSNMSKTRVWFPKGEWFDFFSGLHYSGLGGRKLDVYRPLETYPVFAKAGAIVPMADYSDNNLKNATDMTVTVFPGASNSFTLYEDEGDTNRYRDGHFSKTEMFLTWGENAKFVISGAKGDLSLIPQKRNWKINLRGFNRNIAVSVYVNGKKVVAEFELCKKTNTTTVSVSANVTDEIVVEITGTDLIHDNCDVMERCFDILQNSTMSNALKGTFYTNINDQTKSLHLKIYSITGIDAQYQPVCDAIKELLTLTELENFTEVV